MAWHSTHRREISPRWICVMQAASIYTKAYLLKPKIFQNLQGHLPCWHFFSTVHTYQRNFCDFWAKKFVHSRKFMQQKFFEQTIHENLSCPKKNLPLFYLRIIFLLVFLLFISSDNWSFHIQLNQTKKWDFTQLVARKS